MHPHEPDATNARLDATLDEIDATLDEIHEIIKRIRIRVVEILANRRLAELDADRFNDWFELEVDGDAA